MKWRKHWDTHSTLYELPIFSGASIWANGAVDGTYDLVLEVYDATTGDIGRAPFMTIPLGEDFATATQAKRAAEAWVKEVQP